MKLVRTTTTKKSTEVTLVCEYPYEEIPFMGQ